MRYKYFTVIFLLLTLVFLVQSANSQASSDHRIKVGLTGLLQGSQFDILVPIWVGPYFCIAPGIGIKSAEDAATDIDITIVPRFFLYKEKYAPYIGGRFALMFYRFKDMPNTADLLAGLTIGGEYFLDEHFSFGVEGQLNLTTSDEKSTRFGNPGKQTLNTATAVYATFYF